MPRMAHGHVLCAAVGVYPTAIVFVSATCHFYQYLGLQSVSFAPPEGFTNVDTWAVVISKSPPSEPATSALQEVAAGLASVKSAIMSDAADRNQAIDMLTNLLRETLQVDPCSITFPVHISCAS